MNIVRIRLPEGLTNAAAVDRLAATGCTEATVGAGKAGMLVLDFGDAPLDLEAVHEAVRALGLEDFERCSICSDDDLDHLLGLSDSPERSRVVERARRSPRRRRGRRPFPGVDDDDLPF